jgi:hypothetical protein
MRISMVATTLMLLTTASVARADVPDACSAYASPPANAQIKLPANAAKVSLASCTAEAQLAAVKATPDDAGIAAMNAAAAPILALYDAAIAANDPVVTPLAKAAKADLYLGMAVRLRDSIAPITMSTLGADLQALVAQHDALEPKLQPWLASAKQ